jgi:hypothetical protein
MSGEPGRRDLVALERMRDSTWPAARSFCRPFHVLLAVFRADEVVRTAGNPLSDRPSAALTATTLGGVAIGIALSFTPLAGHLGFVPLPARYFVFLLAATVAYLLLVGVAKRFLLSSSKVVRAR